MPCSNPDSSSLQPVPGFFVVKQFLCLLGSFHRLSGVPLTTAGTVSLTLWLWPVALSARPRRRAPGEQEPGCPSPAQCDGFLSGALFSQVITVETDSSVFGKNNPVRRTPDGKFAEIPVASELGGGQTRRQLVPCVPGLSLEAADLNYSWRVPHPGVDAIRGSPQTS